MASASGSQPYFREAKKTWRPGSEPGGIHHYAMTHYDLIIVGTGSAGLPAGMYASRYKIRNLVIGKEPGGALATSHRVENWPGELGASGADIMGRFEAHAKASGSEVLYGTVASVAMPKPHFFEVTTQAGETFTSDFVILATGNGYKHLGIPGEDRLLGAGVSYCATCDGNFFRKKKVVMVGGGDAAFTEALYLAELCSQVTILVRGDKARAEDIWVDKAQATPNVTIRYGAVPEEVVGATKVEGVRLKGGETVPCDGVFVAVGSLPQTALVDHLGVAKDETGCIVVDSAQRTNVPGLYAAGDITTGSHKFRQTIMSAAEGCLAAHCVHEEILKR